MLARNRTKAREALRLALAVAHGGVEVGLHGDQLPGVLQLRGKAAAATCELYCSYPKDAVAEGTVGPAQLRRLHLASLSCSRRSS